MIIVDTHLLYVMYLTVYICIIYGACAPQPLSCVLVHLSLTPHAMLHVMACGVGDGWTWIAQSIVYVIQSYLSSYTRIG